MSRAQRGRVVKRRLIAGLIAIAPLTATLFVLRWIFQALDGILGRLIYPGLGALFGRERLVIPGLGLLVLFLLLLATGWAAEKAIGGRIIAWWHELLERLPLVRRIYGASNRIVRTVFSEETRPFKMVVLIEYPSPGRWSIGFLSANAPPLMHHERVGEDPVTVFVPTTPNPTTGFLIILPRALLIPLPMTVDEAFTFILSAGSVHPNLAPIQPVDPAAIALFKADLEQP
ncbi:MAG TPA: DUF502 domain-containing protein [Longimicrobiales bacterium]|nr:DUF502 domain-containing protein [Longimicrobiales bacterium]